MRRELVSENGTVRRWRVISDAGNAVGYDDETIPTPEQVNEATLQERLCTLAVATRTYLALTTPTAAQTTAQVRRSARVQLILTRLALRDLADITDTEGN